MTKRNASIVLFLWIAVLFGFHLVNSQVFQGRMAGDISELEKRLEMSEMPTAQREAIHSFALSANQNVQSLSDFNFFILLFGGMVIAARVLIPGKK